MDFRRILPTENLMPTAFLRTAFIALCATVTLAACGTTATAQKTTARTPDTWEGLERVERRGLDAVYVRPGASLAAYRRVMLDPVEVSFDKNWDPRGGIGRLESVNPEQIRQDLGKIAHDVFQREMERGGYQLTSQPGADVLRVRPKIVDLYINAPEYRGPGIVDTYVVDAGEMTLVADLLDSQTNTPIAHVKDKERGRDYSGQFQIANRVTNTAEAERAISYWARMLRNALDSARAQQ
jgi:hypothetical protein